MALTLRRAIGYMPEADALVPGMRGADYVALAGELYGMPRKQALRRAHEVLTYLDLEDARYRKLEEYSTGMKQRLKLAQALVHDPPVLLLDEPTSGMDPAGREAMLDLLLTLGRDHGKSMILSTHLARRRRESLRDGRDPAPRQGLGAGRGSGACAYAVTTVTVYKFRATAEKFLEDLRLEGVQVLHDNGRGELRVRFRPAG